MSNNWEKEFDKKFTRIDKSTGKFEDKWFVKELVKPKDIKAFISRLLKEEREKLEKLGKLAIQTRVGWERKQLIKQFEEIVGEDSTHKYCEATFHDRSCQKEVAVDQAKQEIRAGIKKLKER